MQEDLRMQGLAYHARRLPPTKDKDTFMPTNIPDPIKAGLHSMNQPQLSSVSKAFDLISKYSHVNGCQSCCEGQSIVTWKFDLLSVLTQRTPIANCDRTRQIIAYKNPTESTLIFPLDRSVPSAAKCMLCIVVAVAYDEGNTSCNSRAVCTTKKLLTGVGRESVVVFSA